MDPSKVFFNLYNHDLIRIAVAIPGVRVADPSFNSRQTIALMREAVNAHAIIAPVGVVSENSITVKTQVFRRVVR